MDDSPRNKLIKPLYEQDIKLKVDLALNICANFQKKLTLSAEKLPTARLRAAHYTDIPAELLPEPPKRLLQLPDFENLKMKIRPRMHEMIQDLYLKEQILPILKHVEKFLTPRNLEGLEITEEQLAALKHPFNLRDLLKSLGYKWQILPGTGRKFIMEKPEYVNARYNYLKLVTKYRGEDRDAIYIDIYDIKEKLGYSHGSTDPKETYVISVVSPRLGLLSKSCSDSSESIIRLLEQIVKTVIIPKTEKDGFVVFGETDKIEGENHSVPTKWSSRNEMMAWLDAREIPYSAEMHRSELYDLIQRCNPKAPLRYTWEETLIASGRPFVIRPTWLDDFCLFHECWKGKKSAHLPYFHVEYHKSAKKILQGFANYLNNITPYQWRLLDSVVKKKETDTLMKDKDIEDIIEKVMNMVEVNGLSPEDLAFNELDGVSSGEDGE